jgi:hypothetical protein
MRLRSIAFVLLAAAVATLGVQAPANAAGRVKITKVYFDSPGSDTGSNTSLNAEFVTIKNNKSHTKTLSGWTLRDRGSIHVFVFPTFKLRAGEKVRVHTGSGTNTAHNLYWNAGNYVWNNTGDTAKLRKASGTLVDRCTFSGAGSVASC